MKKEINEPANYWHLINLPGNNQYEISIDGNIRKTFKNGKKKMLTPFRRKNKRNSLLMVNQRTTQFSNYWLIHLSMKFQKEKYHTIRT